MDEAEIDRLYGLPLDEFTRERNELAKRLRAAGDRRGADEVKALQKPTAPAWAVNQLARTNEVQLRALLRSGEKLRDAQRQVLEGAAADVLREAQQEERDVVSRLTAQARELLPNATASVLERVSETLRAAAVGDDETRELLKRGVLTRELEMSGFGALEGMPVALLERTRTAPKKAAGDREERRRLVAAARDRVKQARAAAREAEREASRAEREAQALRAAAEEAAAELARAEEALGRLD